MKDLRYIPSWEVLKRFKLVNSYIAKDGHKAELLNFTKWQRYVHLMSLKGYHVEGLTPDVSSNFVSKVWYEEYRSRSIRMFDAAHDGELSGEAIQCLGQVGDDDLK